MKNKPLIAVLAAGTFWGFMGLFARKLNAAGFGALEVAQARITTGLILVGIYLLIFDKKSLQIRLKDVWCFIGTGIVSLFFFSICYSSALNYTSLSVAAILLYTAPVFVMLMSLFLFKEKMNILKIVGLLLAFAGCVLVSGIGGDSSVSLIGILLGLGSGFFYALYSIFGRFALAHYKPLTVTYYTFVCAGIASLFVGSPAQVVTYLGSNAMVPLFALGLVVIGTVLPFVMYTKGLAEIESGKAAILASVEPVAAALVGVIAFGEPMTMAVVMGLVCILTAVYILR